MKTSDFYFDLPERLIAQTPLAHRPDSRLFYLPAHQSAERLEQPYHFYDLPSLVRPGDCLVLNESKVIPARLYGVKQGGTARIELLLLKRLDLQRWECLLKPAKRVPVGHKITFIEGELEAEVEAVLEEGNRIVRFDFDGTWEALLDRAGQMPLPPYIHERLDDQSRYQTVYAKEEGSAAAPTAGLHFTETLLKEIEAKGVDLARVTLHVGLGTFRPVQVDAVESHHMHSESYVLDQENCEKINRCRRKGGRVISIGTTSCRVLETVADEEGTLKPASGETDIFIYPGYRFKIVDVLVTNFHLPESTLLMLCSAFAGKERILSAYQQAVEEEFRFFSFGDAMWIEKKEMCDA